MSGVASPYHRAMSRRLVSPTLVGRETERAAMSRALDRAIAGTPTHQLIAGEAGVGKSRLVAEVAAMASARGMRVLIGGCANVGDGSVPYAPFVEALRNLAQELEPAELEALVGSSRTDLAHLVPAFGPAIAIDRATQSESLQARLLDAVLSLLQRLSQISPVVLVVEDLHWADPATRETVAFLVRHVRTERVVLVMTFRADELHRRHPLLPWLAELDRSGRVERIDLERLDPADTRELLEAILGAPPSGDLTDRIHRRSDGNPFFIEELLMAGDDGAGGPLPPTLREVLLARISAMPDRAQTVIGVAAVAGRRVDHGLLAKVAAMDEHDLLDGLRTAVASQVLVTSTNDAGDDGDYAFRHALLQEAAYDDLLPGERLAIHLAFAEALAERGPGSGAIAAGHWAELAYHWSAARDDRRPSMPRSGRARPPPAPSRSPTPGGTTSGPSSCGAGSRDRRTWPGSTGSSCSIGRPSPPGWPATLAGPSRSGGRPSRPSDRDADPIRVGSTLERLGRSLWVNAETEAALEAHEAAVRIMPAEPPTAELARVLSGYGQILMLLDRWSEKSTVLCKRAVDIAP